MEAALAFLSAADDGVLRELFDRWLLEVLEAARAATDTPFWFGDRISHADIAVACVLRFTHEAHPQLFEAAYYPALAAHAARCEALPPFREIVQPLIPPS